MIRCPVPNCITVFDKNDFGSLTNHFIQLAEGSDPNHIGWLNKNLTSQKTDAETLQFLFKKFFDYSTKGFPHWIKQTFIKKFYTDPIHPFIENLQHPSKAIILGYVLEHQHFLKQWTRSCALILGKTTEFDVMRYEFENIQSEFGGHNECGFTSHYELLIRMGESQGLARNEILQTQPLEGTEKALTFWNDVANNYHWVEAMLAMHGLELVANKNLRDEGAKKHYFDPDILNTNEITQETKNFLREGYEADVHHAEEAIKLVEKYAMQYDMIEDVQSTFLKSIEVFDQYLICRLERAEQLENP